MVARYHFAMNAPAQKPEKFRRYRERMKARGLKQVRMWVQDPSAPGFREALAAEIRRINASPESEEAMRFIEAVSSDLFEGDEQAQGE